MDRDQRGLRILWLLVAFVAVGAIAIAIAALASTETEPTEPEKPLAEAARPDEGDPRQARASDEDGPKRTERGDRSGSPGPRDASSVTAFACKTDVGVDAPTCGTVYEANGLRVQADCRANGLAAVATVPDAVMTAETITSEGESFGSIPASTVDRGFPLISAENPTSSGTVTFTPPDSSLVILVDFSATYSPGGPQGDCVFLGTVRESQAE